MNEMIKVRCCCQHLANNTQKVRSETPDRVTHHRLPGIDANILLNRDNNGSRPQAKMPQKECFASIPLTKCMAVVSRHIIALVSLPSNIKQDYLTQHKISQQRERRSPVFLGCCTRTPVVTTRQSMNNKLYRTQQFRLVTQSGAKALSPRTAEKTVSHQNFQIKVPTPRLPIAWHQHGRVAKTERAPVEFTCTYVLARPLATVSPQLPYPGTPLRFGESPKSYTGGLHPYNYTSHVNVTFATSNHQLFQSSYRIPSDPPVVCHDRLRVVAVLYAHFSMPGVRSGDGNNRPHDSASVSSEKHTQSGSTGRRPSLSGGPPAWAPAKGTGAGGETSGTTTTGLGGGMPRWAPAPPDVAEDQGGDQKKDESEATTEAEKPPESGVTMSDWLAVAAGAAPGEVGSWVGRGCNC